MKKPNITIPEISPAKLSSEEKDRYFASIKKLLERENAVLVAHFYTLPEIQELAEETGGCVGDSLEMAKFGARHSAKTLVIAGVKFMAEAAKILNPDKRILMPTQEAECSLDIGCPPEEFAKFCAKHKDRTVVVYINTSAKIKALADWVVTSSIAVDVVNYLHRESKKILWAPDRYLGEYIKNKTGADMILWNGSCIVHEEFKAQGVRQLKKLYPAAAVLVHPESPRAVTELADVVGSTAQLIRASQELPNDVFIVATEAGVLYQMQKFSPRKQFIVAPTVGFGATCKSCAKCPWMKMNSLAGVEKCLATGCNEILVEKEIREKALKSLQRMMDFKT